MNELKKLVHEVLQDEKHGSQILEENQELFHDLGKAVPPIPDLPSTDNEPILLEPNINEPNNYDEGKVQDITHEMEDESLSLELKEKEMIIKALKKNNNKRKYAARDLGISERTLYRKIKHYEIDD